MGLWEDRELQTATSEGTWYFNSILHQKLNPGEEKWSRILKKGDWDGRHGSSGVRGRCDRDMDSLLRHAGGVQKYTYTFKVDGNKLTGKAKSELANSETEIVEGTVNGDDISFVENLNFQDMPLRIVYKGKISGGEIKFTRTILDMFMEELVAKRAK